uniref:HECT-type E3 ubiquitin transferase n=1 Tax=Pinguiococcus pyrenoidosus TaxID=172671 RepID=A0A7R9UH32_9STRA
MGHPLSLDDLEGLDPELLHGFRKLLDFEPADAIEELFCLTYQVQWSGLGEEHMVELIPGGKDVPVTGANREDYVEKYMRYMLIDSVKQQFAPFREGFIRVMGSSKVVQLLTAMELEYLVVGEPQLDFHALESNTEYVGFNKDDPFIRQFWSVVHSMDLASQQQLLMFVTGSSKAPVGGLGKLTFRIQRAGPDSNHLPTSHTCFNVLLLPQYETMAKLHDRLHIAIREHQGFGLQ